MSEEIKIILEEIRFKAGIYRDHKKRGLSFNDEEKNCALLLGYIQQKENIIKEVRKKLIKSKEYQAVKSLGLNSKMSILIELEEILEKENKE